jgi:2-oxoglutarate ferredoxin oxidoreductase subunit beta
MMDAAMDHDGFSFIECLSECTEFFAGAFDSSNPRKGGEFKLMPEDHDPTDEAAAYALASEDFPGRFGIFYQIQRPTKNALEAGVIDAAQGKFEGKPDSEVLQATFNLMK